MPFTAWFWMYESNDSSNPNHLAWLYSTILLEQKIWVIASAAKVFSFSSSTSAPVIQSNIGGKFSKSDLVLGMITRSHCCPSKAKQPQHCCRVELKSFQRPRTCTHLVSNKISKSFIQFKTIPGLWLIEYVLQ